VNRLAFEITDDSGNHVSRSSAVTAAVLKDPGGVPIALSTLSFDPIYDYYGSRFDPVSSSWIYNTPSPRQLSMFYADILDPLSIGAYTLEVSVDDGQTLVGTINFNYLIDLPIISSHTFQISNDLAGNLYWTWDTPEQLLDLAKIYDLEIMAGVAAMLRGELVAFYGPKVPVEMGFSFTPSSIFQNLLGSADEIRFAFQVRTSNNNARAYSNRIIVSDLSSPISIVPEKSTEIVTKIVTEILPFPIVVSPKNK
jgi:hypothetical protein